MKPDDAKESGRAQSLALAAALAMLGLSVGVNVQELLAASPTEAVPSNQNKIGHEGIKRDAAQIKKDSLQQKLDSRQHKLPAMQDKRPVMPGVKPVDPARP
jgi:hypothetical protein